MNSKGWSEHKVGDFCETISKTHKFQNGKVVFLNTGDIEKGKFLHKKYSSPDGLPGQAKKSIQKGDILLSEIRPANGRYAFVDFDADDYVVSTKLMVIRAKENISPRYLYHFLTNSETTKILQHLAESRSGTFPQITFTQVQDLEILIPELKTQKQIASFIDSIDETIDVNQQINKTLEDMAKAIFKEWFVDFNFPNATGKFQETEIGKIPVGWKVGKLGDVAEINPKLSLQKGSISKYVEMKDLSENSSIIKGYREREFSSGSKFQNGDTLLARITPCLENGKTGLVSILDENETGWGSTEFIVLRGKGNVGSLFIYCLSRYEPFRNHAIKSMLGSSGRQRVVESMLIEFSIAIPPNDLLINFEKLVSPFFLQINNNEKENQSLINLRDTLLPKLMKGEIELSEE